MVNGRVVDRKIARRRFLITIMAVVLAVIFSGISLAMMSARVPNMHIILLMVLGFSALLVVYLVIWTLGASEKHAKLAKVLRRCYLVFVSAGLAFFLTLQGLIISGARSDEAEADCLIVLGAGLRNGSPSLILRRRLNAAIDYLVKWGDIPVIVTGGLGRGESITEAEAMFRYLRDRGVDEGLIWKEEESTSTRENLTFALSIMEEKGADIDSVKVAIVSSEFHLYRAKLIAGRQGLDAVGVAAETPGFYLRSLYSFREAFALAYAILL